MIRNCLFAPKANWKIASSTHNDPVLIEMPTIIIGHYWHLVPRGSIMINFIIDEPWQGACVRVLAH